MVLNGCGEVGHKTHVRELSFYKKVSCKLLFDWSLV